MLTTLPPGQRCIDGFPRFGAHLGGPNPTIPIDPVIEIRGAVTSAFKMPLARLADLPSRDVFADFHCVAGWTATNLSWEGVPFRDFYRELIEPALAPHSVVTHFMFRGLDRQKSVLTIEDALADDVLIAERLNGHPLDGDHGAPPGWSARRSTATRASSTCAGSTSAPPSRANATRTGSAICSYGDIRGRGSGRRSGTVVFRSG